MCCRRIRGAKSTGRLDGKRKTWLQQDLEAGFDPMLGLWNRRGYYRGLYRMYFLSAEPPPEADMAHSLPSVITRKVPTQPIHARLIPAQVPSSPHSPRAALSETLRDPSAGDRGGRGRDEARIKIPGGGEGLRLYLPTSPLPQFGSNIIKK